MTDYSKLIPPVGVDHVEYALKRVGHSAARIRVRNVNEAAILTRSAAGPTVRLSLKKPLDPYYDVLPQSNDSAAWTVVKRVVRRFPIQDVLAHLFPNGIYQAFTNITQLTSQLNAGGLGLVAQDYTYSRQHNELTINIVNPTSLLGYGTGKLKLTETLVVDRHWNEYPRPSNTTSRQFILTVDGQAYPTAANSTNPIDGLINIFGQTLPDLAAKLTLNIPSTANYASIYNIGLAPVNVKLTDTQGNIYFAWTLRVGAQA